MKKFIIGKVDKVMMVLYIFAYRNIKPMRHHAHASVAEHFKETINSFEFRMAMLWRKPEETNDMLFQNCIDGFVEGLKESNWPVDVIEGFLDGAHVQMRADFDARWEERRPRRLLS
jgi:hypothetical protein